MRIPFLRTAASAARSSWVAVFIILAMLLAPVAPAKAADDSITINSVTLTLSDDADDNDIANIGDTILVEANVTNTDGVTCNEGVTTTVTVDLTAYGGSATFGLGCAGSGDGAITWSGSFEIADAGVDGIDVGPSNAASAVTVTADDEDEDAPITEQSNNLAEAVDTIAPTVTAGNIEITGTPSGNGGEFIIGDVVTATWDDSASGDDNGDTDSVTMDFSDFGGPADVVATSADDVWTASYTIVAGSIEDDHLNVSVTATDDAGNVSASMAGTDDATVDNKAPDAPQSSPAAGTFSSSVNVTLTSADADAIYYTLDGSAPDCSATEYTGPITLTSTKTIKAVGCDTAGNKSAVASFTFTKASHSSGGGGGVVSCTPDRTTFCAGASAASTADIAALQEQLRALILQLVALGGTPPPGFEQVTGVRDLTLGATGADVTALQNLLIAQGHAIPAGATGYFGSQTRAALAAYQGAHGIVPAAGYFGPITRSQMKAAGLSGLWW